MLFREEKEEIMKFLVGVLNSVLLVALLTANVAAEMPDVLGIQLGMPVRDAHAKLQAQMPKSKIQVMSDTLPTIDQPVIKSFSSASSDQTMMGVESDQVTVDVTMPPNKQTVWRVIRQHFFTNKGILKTTLLASLREKYGKETRTNFSEKQPATDDSQIHHLLWLFDEQGRPAPLPSKPKKDGPDIANQSTLTWCAGIGEGAPLAMIEVYSNSKKGVNYETDWCYSSYNAVVVTVTSTETPELYTQMHVFAVSLPLALHAAEATSKWKNDIAEGQHKQDIEKAKQQEKPKL
jgi:hypothetical protein